MQRSIVLLLFSVFLSSDIFAGDRKIEVAGSIRCASATGCSVIDDATHTSINIESVTIVNGVIVIHFPFEAEVIHTFMVTPDDSLALSGYYTGASVGTDSARVLISRYEDGGVEVIDAETLDVPYSNIWVYGLFTIVEE